MVVVKMIDLRSSQRWPLDLKAALRVMQGLSGEYETEALPATVLNLSRMGCCLGLEEEVAARLDLTRLVERPEKNPCDLVIQVPDEPPWRVVALAERVIRILESD